MSNSINPLGSGDFSSIVGTQSTDYQKLMASMGTNKTSSSNSLEGLTSDFLGIKNGSYKKLVSAYYKKQNVSDDETVKKEYDNRKLVAGNASSLKASAEALKRTKFTSDDKDKEAALKAVKAFISDYNSVIDTADDVNDKNTLRNTVWMKNIMDKSVGLLSEVGISVGKDNKLSLDETKWGNANNSTKISLFNGKNSVADKVLYKAGQINTAAGGTVSKGGSYTASGKYSSGTTASSIDTET